MRYYLFLPFLLFFFFTTPACKKEKATLFVPEISEFKLEAWKNGELITTDVVAIISSGSISLSVPENFQLKRVTPTFTTNASEVVYNNIPIQSGVTEITMANNDQITLKGKGAMSTYKIVINYLPGEGLVFDNFSLEKTNNPSLESDIRFSNKEDSLLATGFFDAQSYIPSFTTNATEVLVNNTRQVSGVTAVNLSAPVRYTLVSKTGFKKVVIVYYSQLFADIPHIFISTVNNAPVNSKDVYVSAGIKINGHGKYADYTDSTQIRGRGNSTWSYPKKPYRLKLKTKAALFGLSAEKDWVLLANYLDPTLMLNATALKLGQLLNVPYTNTTLPVELTINGVYQGAYTFTEQIEVETNRVNVKGGALLELDSYFDEDWKFRSAPYNLPVNVKYPDLTTNSELEVIKNQFNSSLALLSQANFPNNNYLDSFDSSSFVNYLLVYWLTDNRELNHPKSSYMHLQTDGKYYFGPIWDFDWAYGYETDGKHFITYNASYFASRPISYGTNFFKRFLDDPRIKAKIKRHWNEFRANNFGQLTTYVSQQGKLIKNAYDNNNKTWKRSGNSTSVEDAQRLNSWLTNRAAYLDNYISGL